MNTISTTLNNLIPRPSQILAGPSKPRRMTPRRRITQEAHFWFDFTKIWTSDRDFIDFQEMNPLETTDRIRAAWIQAGRNPANAARYLADPTWLPGLSTYSSFTKPGNID